MSVGKIQRTPRGLLQFLGMVGTGVPPTELADEVRANFPLLPFLGSTIAQNVGASGSVQAVGDVVTVPVPAGQAWILIAGNYGSALAAADEARYSFRILTKDGNFVRLHTSQWFGSPYTPPGVQNGITGFTLPMPFVLTAGESIEAILDVGPLAAPVTCTCNAYAYVFDV